MDKMKRYREVFVEADFLTARDDIIREVVKVTEDTYKVRMDHPVFGDTIEVFELDESDDTLCLRSVFPIEMQDSAEEFAMVSDYYNNFLLDGENTYIDYYNKEVGYFLLSRNVGIYPVGETEL